MTAAQRDVHEQIKAQHPNARYVGHLDDVRTWYKLPDGSAIVVRPDGTTKTWTREELQDM
jgi:phosphomannomutase